MNLDDKPIKCKKCFSVLGNQRMQSQILVINDDVAIYNFVRLKCLRCEAINEWTSGNLDSTDFHSLNDLPKVERVKSNQGAGGVAARLRTVRKRPNYGIREDADGKFNVWVGKYIGRCATFEDAVKMRDAAILEQQMQKLGYTAKDNNADYQLENQTAAT